MEVTDNIDSLSCELLGGRFPLVIQFVTPKERYKIAHELAVLDNASFIEIGDGVRKKCKQFKLITGEPDTKTKPKGIG